MNFPRVVLPLLLLTTACGPRAGELDTPVYLWNQEEDLCGSSIAMDAHGELWSEGGCESGGMRMSRNREATEAERARIVAAYDAHPDPEAFETPGCDAEEYPTRFHKFQVLLGGGEARTWRLCTRWDEIGDANNSGQFPPPFDETVRAFSERR